MNVLEFFRDESRKPFGLYWLIIAVAVMDIISHHRWDSMFESYTQGVPMGGGWAGGHIFLSYEMQIVMSVAFILCMLKWPELGIGFVALYAIFQKILLYFTVAGLLIGVKSVNQSFTVPSYLLIWEVAAFSILIAYMVKKELIIRSPKRIQINVPLKYKIQDDSQGRIFIVEDQQTGDSIIYQSVDQMPQIHYEVFVRMLKDKNL